MRAVWKRFDHESGNAEGNGRRFRRQDIGVLLVAVLFLLGSTLVIGYDALAGQRQSLALDVGQVVPQDILAPFSTSYESDVLTNQRRQVAINSIPFMFDPPDSSIARQQVQLARQILDYIADVRADEYATPEMLQADLRAISAVSMTDEEVRGILDVSPERWLEIDQQIITVLERAMRSEIREDTLRSIKLNLPNLVSVRFHEDEVTLITTIVEDLIATNTFYNEERTRQARQAAADAVAPEVRSFEQGQLVIRAGSIVSEADMEALTQFGLLQPSDRRLQELLGAVVLSGIVLIVFALYLTRFHPRVASDPTMLFVLAAIYVLVLLGMRIVGPDRVVQPYAYPSAALGLLFTALVGPQIAIMGIVGLAVMIGFTVSNAFALTTITLLGGVAGVLALQDKEQFNSYFIAGLVVGATNAGIVIAFFLNGYPADSLGALTLVAAGIINGFLAGLLALAGLYVISGLFNIPTSLRLMELTQPNQPLLQRLLREAPGTYQHSLQVANLAELAAERIGANNLLTRVGALYHDVGKTKAPHFFIENQADGVNPHDGLDDPLRSARIIIGHVEEGDIMARQAGLPARIRDFILEHHGTTYPLYFYRKALEQVNGDEDALDQDAFRYDGPRPRSRETAILMLADSCESVVRARRPKNKQEIADIVKYVFDTRMAEGQLDDCDLSFRDLSEIQRVFVESLQGVFHPRIAYIPGDKPQVADEKAAGDQTPAGSGNEAELLAALDSPPSDDGASDHAVETAGEQQEIQPGSEKAVS